MTIGYIIEKYDIELRNTEKGGNTENNNNNN